MEMKGRRKIKSLYATKSGKPTGLQAQPPESPSGLRRSSAPFPLLVGIFYPFQTDRGLPPFPQFPTDPYEREAATGNRGGNTIADRQPPDPHFPWAKSCPSASGSGLGLCPPPWSCKALVALTLSARWWTRPRPGSASSCSSPNSGNNRRPEASRGLREPERPTGAGAAIFVPASPAASSPAHFRG